MKSPAQIISEKISTIGLGWILAKNLFIGSEPAEPSDTVTTYDTGGVEQDPKWADDNVTVQIRHRCSTYDKGYSNLQKIRLALEGIAPYSNGDNKVEGIWVQAPVTFIGKTTGNQSLFVLNIRILLTPEDKGNRQDYNT